MFISGIQLVLLLFCIHVANTYKSCPGDCVLVRNCADALAMLKNPRILDIERYISMRNSICNISHTSGNSVCCSDFKNFSPRTGDEGQDNAPIFITSTSAFTTTTTTSTTTTEPTTTRLPEHPNMKLLPDTCGEISDFTNRIVGGEVAYLYEYPWMALIGHRTGNNLTEFSCSGTLINPKYVLTAAHCINNNIYGVRVGEFNIKDKNDCDNFVCGSEAQDLKIEKIITHHKYESHRSYSTHDIALIRLQGSVNMTNSIVGTICLPVTPSLRNAILTGKQATVVGWGVTEHEKMSSILRRVDVPVFSHERCKNLNRKMSEEEFTVICAGGTRRDSCRGDSGGPLFITDVYNSSSSYAHSYIQFGIVSRGPTSCGNGVPAVYTDVRMFVDWILDHITE